MKVIIIGASGLIGRKLFLVLKKKYKTIGTFNSNKAHKKFIRFDIKKDKISKINKEIKKNDIFIILSAYSNPGWISQNKKEAENVNVLMTKKLIDQIIKLKCKIIFMSSVEVFNGKKKYFLEKDKPKPLNFYGKAKYEIEKYIQKKSKNYLILRTSWNSDKTLHGRCVIELTYNTIKKKNAKMAKDNLFSITNVEDTCSIIQKHLMSKNKILHIASREKISRSILANRIKNYSKKKLKFKIVTHSKINYLEPRSKINLLRSDDEIIKKYNFKKIDFLIRRKTKLLDAV
jgi:dTDP-4-dehydrorhamnose reductase